MEGYTELGKLAQSTLWSHALTQTVENGRRRYHDKMASYRVILGIICVVLLILTVTQREDIRSLEDRIVALESGLTATAAEHESSRTESSVIAGDSQANQSSSGTKVATLFPAPML